MYINPGHSRRANCRVAGLDQPSCAPRTKPAARTPSHSMSPRPSATSRRLASLVQHLGSPSRSLSPTAQPVSAEDPNDATVSPRLTTGRALSLFSLSRVRVLAAGCLFLLTAASSSSGCCRLHIDHRRAGHQDGAVWRAAGHREDRDFDPGPHRRRLRHLHPALERRRARRRRVPGALPDRAPRQRDRGHLELRLRQLLLALRPRAQQRALRRRPGSLGYQGQGCRHARPRPARRQAAQGRAGAKNTAVCEKPFVY
jgi:hypothetical protein